MTSTKGTGMEVLSSVKDALESILSCLLLEFNSNLDIHLDLLFVHLFLSVATKIENFFKESGILASAVNFIFRLTIMKIFKALLQHWFTFKGRLFIFRWRLLYGQLKHQNPAIPLLDSPCIENYKQPSTFLLFQAWFIAGFYFTVF